ncbi:MAG: sulfatase [Deltaproteobacteria bacterium]|nr:sulfatase [Deltaproteobacteria bacterium]MBN2673160.1 sulfatase [Deltaproteobacteria bacterium]
MNCGTARLGVMGAFFLLFIVGCKDKPRGPGPDSAGEPVTVGSDSATAIDYSKDTGALRKKSEEAQTAQKHFGPLSYAPMPSVFQVPKSPTKPNVILLIIDAMNVSHMSAYGYHRNTTPNLSKLATKGMVFTNYISNSSWTRPSFTSIITGLTKKGHGVELKNRDVRMDITTLAEHFRLAGYRTAGLTGNPLTRGVWGYNQGYQVYEDTHTMERAFPPDGWLTERAIDWIKSVKQEPFFLKIFFTAPHAPYRPVNSAKHFVTRLKTGQVVEYPFREYKTPLNKDDHEMTVAAYDDEVRYTDIQIGRLMKTLKEIGVSQKTAIVVTADHGEMLGEHNCYTHAYHMWEETLRVPFVMYLPWQKSGGVYSDELFTHVDIMPTLLDVASIPDRNAAKRPGKSILAAVADGTRSDRIHISQYNAHGIQRQAVRSGRYKLIHHHKVNASALEQLNSLHENIPHADPGDLASIAVDGERYEFYDLVADPRETIDLNPTMQNADAYKALRIVLEPELGEEVEDDNQLSPEMIEALQNAGYML